MEQPNECESFGRFNNTILKLEEECLIPVCTNTVVLIHHKLYIGSYSCILVFPTNTIKHSCIIRIEDVGHICDIAQLSDNSMIIATNQGLYHTSADGEILKTIEEGEHNSVIVSNDIVIVSRLTNSVITSYIRNPDWQPIKSLALPCGSSLVTLALLRDIMYAVSAEEGVIYSISHTTGSVLSTLDCNEELSYPRACQLDKIGKLLVCDKNNDRLKVMDSSGSFNVIQTDVKLNFPKAAVVLGDNLFVLDHNKLYKFS